MQRGDIAGGTNVPGIPAAVFAMPPGLRIRYDRPASDIADFITGYHVFATDADTPRMDWFLPSVANVQITFDAGPIEARIGNHRFSPLAQASLFGPSSRAMVATTRGGVMIGFGLTALGWARIGRRDAHDIHNRVVPATQILSAPLVNAMTQALSEADEASIAPILDAYLRTAFDVPHRDEEVIRALMTVIVDDIDHDIATASEMVGVSSARLRRVALRHFGLTPKLLFRRARFLWSYLQIMASGDIENYAAIDASYFDASHFLRDAQSFLGTTPRRFAALPTDFLQGSLRARAAVLGAATQALHDIDRARTDPASSPGIERRISPQMNAVSRSAHGPAIAG